MRCWAGETRVAGGVPSPRVDETGRVSARDLGGTRPGRSDAALDRVRDAVGPDPLAWILLGMTALTGVIDAISILGLGQVFVANMTGNVVFLGFALAGAAGFSVQSAVVALAGFLVGAFLGGWAIRRRDRSRPALLSAGLWAESLLIVVALGIWLAGGTQPAGPSVDLVIALTAGAMGVQNATVRKLAVPDLTTTVLTLTLTGLAADPPGPDRRTSARRILAVVAMLLGALVGALVVLQGGPAVGLALVIVMLSSLAAWAHRSAP